jgi:ribosome hibernation promoting factor
MQFRIHARSANVNGDLREFIASRVLAKLSRTRRRIRSVDVYLEDTNGPRGGAGELIRVIVRLRPAGRVVIRHLSLDPRSGIYSAAERAIQAVRRAIGCRRTKRLRRAQQALHISRRLPRRHQDLQSVGADLN